MKKKKKKAAWKRFVRKLRKKLYLILNDRKKAVLYLRIILAVLVLLIAILIVSLVRAFTHKSDQDQPKDVKTQIVKEEQQNEDAQNDAVQMTIQQFKENQPKLEEVKTKLETEASLKNIVRDEHGQAVWDTSGAEKVVYLTFDDGPSELTPQFLDVLKSYGVHATFFVIYKPEFEEYYKREVEEGHAVQIHTATHDFNTVYSSYDAYMQDFWTAHNYVEQVTGVYPMYFRFPGGSANSFDVNNVAPVVARSMADSGFQFVDWTTSTGDGNADTIASDMLPKIQYEISIAPERVVILAHDSNTKSETLAALPGIIEYFQNEGYAFGVISNNVDMTFTQYISY